MDWLNGVFVASFVVVDALALRAIVRRWFDDSNFYVRLLAGLVLFWATIVLGAILLNFVNGLSGSLLHVVTATLLVGLAAIVVSKCGPATNPALIERKPHSLGRVIATHALLGMVASYLVTYGILQLPMDWDSLAYHLPLIDHWIQSGSLWNRDCAFWYCPGNNELLGLFLATGFTGDFWVQAHNLVPCTILAVSILELAREVGLGQRYGLALLASLMMTQPVIRQLISAENDLSVVALVSASSLFGWRYARRPAIADLALLGCCVGILGGVKYYALAYMLAASVMPFFWLLARRRFKPAGAVVVSSLLGFLLLGSFWYVRNWSLTGTPLFPKGILGFPDYWAEMRPGFEHSNLLNSQRTEVWPLLSRAWLIQAGPISWLFVFMSFFVPLLAIINWRRLCAMFGGSSRRGMANWICLYCASCMSVYLITPNVVETEAGTMNMLQLQYHPVRFGLPVMVFSGLLIANAIRQLTSQYRRIGQWLTRISIGVLCVQIAWQVLAMFNFRDLPTALGVYFWWPQGRERR
jgi:hypothetical protein